MATNNQDNGQFNINEHFNELMKSIGLDPADTGGSITFVGEDPIMESRIRLGAAYSMPYMGTAAAAAMTHLHWQAAPWRTAAQVLRSMLRSC